ncbi:MAG: hypothetical protein A2504_14880 [Bdellovibrionales bacterium RIFOXYD12_FULL_39_22]|nr:MAG: hypothetical protein A2560_03780 [Bdellovibrionales bacterium RIFOXYD1_FULL_39_84]OFZ91998.1 MAG: hypothetical protein A2504_14880 [Bdellovibrionales bacterium RIFOXYD12_FULL_39_22]
MNSLQKYCQKELAKQKFDCLAVGAFDLNSAEIFFFELTKNKSYLNTSPIYFDLASLTKPLTLGVLYLENEKIFDEEMLLLLEHRAGLPAHGRLAKSEWRDFISSYAIKATTTTYSDFSALRLMLELEKKLGVNLKKRCETYWDQELLYWKDLSPGKNCAVTGLRGGREITAVVHDDNAFVLDEFVVHAGLFATVEGLCKTLININKKLNLQKKILDVLATKKEGRFVRGWDIATGETSLAGPGFVGPTIGHLGFTGTSLWIDLKSGKGYALLTNYTQYANYERMALNKLRREVGSFIWNNFT